MGNGTASNFPFTFKVFEPQDVVVVKLNSTTSAETTLTLTTDYTVALNDDQNGNPGGSVTLKSGGVTVNLQTGFTLVITSNLQPLQSTDLTNQGGFFPEVINDALDKAVILHQQQEEIVSRSIRFGITNTIGSLEISENAAARANKVLAFDASGEFQVAQELGVFRGDWQAGIGYNVRDLVKDASNNNIYIVNVAHTSSGSTPLKTNGTIGNFALIVDAEAAAASAAAALASENAAAQSFTDTDAARAAAVQAKDDAQTANTNSQSAAAAALANNQSSAANAINAANSATAAISSAQAAAASAASAASSSGGGTVKVTNNDTTPLPLFDKLEPGFGLNKTLINAGANEKISLTSDSIIYAIALG